MCRALRSGLVYRLRDVGSFCNDWIAVSYQRYFPFGAKKIPAHIIIEAHDFVALLGVVVDRL